jgi:hypothetical protein
MSYMRNTPSHRHDECGDGFDQIRRRGSNTLSDPIVVSFKSVFEICNLHILKEEKIGN